MTTSLGREQLPLLKSVSDSSSVLLFTPRCHWVDSTTGEESCFHHLASHAVWPDWADFLHFGQLFKACGNNYFTQLASIIRQFLKRCQNLIFLVKSFMGKFYWHLATFFWSHWIHMEGKVYLCTLLYNLRMVIPHCFEFYDIAVPQERISLEISNVVCFITFHRMNT